MKNSLIVLIWVLCFPSVYSQNRELNLVDSQGLKHGVWEREDSIGKTFYVLYEHGEKLRQFYSPRNIRYAGIKSYKSVEEALNEPLEVIILSLNGNSLNSLPKNILAFKNLEVLNLSQNPNLDWSKTFELISNLDSLRWLFLEENEIKKIPDNISKLTQLRSIWFSDNQIKDIPIAFNKLENLEEIWLDNNPIALLPEELRKSNFKKKIVNNWTSYEGDFEVISENYNYKNNINLINQLEANSFLVLDADTINRVDSDGKMQGLWRVKYHNQRSWQVEFVDGEPDGKFYMFDYNGSILLHGEFKNGKKVGLWKGTIHFVKQDAVLFDEEGIESEIRRFNLTDSVFQVGQVSYASGLPVFFLNSNDNALKDAILRPYVDFLLTNNDLKIEIIANCGIDQSNHPSYSRVYSVQNARLVYVYFVENGINPNRLKYSTNEDLKFEYLIPKTKQERDFNRRIEIRIIETKDSKR